MEEVLPPQTQEGAGFESTRLRQLTVFLENRVGRLQTLLRALEEGAGPVVALAIEESGDSTLVRLICADADVGRDALKAAGLPFSENDVLGVELPRKSTQPLLAVSAALLAAEINIHYVYPMLSRPRGPALVMYVDDITLAAQLLIRKRFTLIGESDLKNSPGATFQTADIDETYVWEFGSMVEKRVHSQLCLHGCAVNIAMAVPRLNGELDRLEQAFAVDEWPRGIRPIRGEIRTFDYSQVARTISSGDVALLDSDGLTELYQQGDCYWLVDERWGMTEINLTAGRWRSWIVPQSRLDDVFCFEAAVLWPMAQLLRSRGLELLPAISIEKNGWGALIISPYGIEPEISRLILAGYRIIGQRWTAIRLDDPEMSLLHIPGRMEKMVVWRASGLGTIAPVWMDLVENRPRASVERAACRAVLMIEPGRRSNTSVRDFLIVSAETMLRQTWPMIRLPLSRRRGALPAKLAAHCRCMLVQLSRNVETSLGLIESMRRTDMARPERKIETRGKATVELSLTLDHWENRRVSA